MSAGDHLVIRHDPSETTVSGEDEEMSPLQSLKARQAKEKKELQAKIASLKHGVTKNDKKRKKEVTQQVEAMEKELRDRHEEELKSAESQMAGLQLGPAPASAATTDSGDSLKTSPVAGNQLPKPSKAQMRREKKADDAKRRQAAALEDERNAEFGERHIEGEKLDAMLRGRNLESFEIPPDGDCLFNSIAHQLGRKDLDGETLRRIAAENIRTNLPEYLPFLTHSDGEPLKECEVENYLRGVENSCRSGGAWGGEMEIRAISAALGLRIEVLQPSGQSTVYDSAADSASGERRKPLVITYHRFSYSLGEHYNSTAPLKTESGGDS